MKKPRTSIAVLVLAGAAAAKVAAQAADPGADLGALKNMSIEQLLDTEVTSVSGYPQKLLDAASAIQVVTNQDIEDSTAATLPEAMRLADNLDVAQKDPHDWAISARGFNSNLGDKMLVLMDGRSVYTPLFAGVFWSSQDYLLEDVDQIEVISGPGGTLWGANAVNGVISITSKSSADTQGTYVEAGGGTVLQDLFGLRYGGTLAPNVTFRVYGKYFGEGDAALPNGLDATDSWHQGQGGFRLDATTPDNLLTLQGDLNDGNLNIESGGEARLAGANLLGRWSHTYSDDAETSLQLYWDRGAPGRPLSGERIRPGRVPEGRSRHLRPGFPPHLAGRRPPARGLGYWLSFYRRRRAPGRPQFHVLGSVPGAEPVQRLRPG